MRRWSRREDFLLPFLTFPFPLALRQALRDHDGMVTRRGKRVAWAVGAAALAVLLSTAVVVLKDWSGEAQSHRVAGEEQSTTSTRGNPVTGTSALLVGNRARSARDPIPQAVIDGLSDRYAVLGFGTDNSSQNLVSALWKTAGSDSLSAATLLAQLRENGLKSIQAQVNAVDIDEGLIVLSQGKDKGVKLRALFLVFQSGQLVGMVQVIKAYPSLSGARVLDTRTGMKIQRGATAISPLGPFDVDDLLKRLDSSGKHR